MSRKDKRRAENSMLAQTHDAGTPNFSTEIVVADPFLKGEEKFQNGLGNALGFAQFSGVPGNFGGNYMTSGQQVEDSTTIFDNLRWYLVSNFRQMLSQAFAEIGLIQTICCVPVDDGLRGGFTLKSQQLNEAQIKDLQIVMKREGDIHNIGWTAKWNRLYGGAGTLILVDDQDPEKPLNLRAINKKTEIECRASDMWELFWDRINIEGDGYDPAIQQQRFTYYNYYGENVHKSRVLRMKGLEAPSFIRPRLRGWGLSEVERLVRSINQYLKSTSLTFEVLDEFKVDVFKLHNLINTLLTPDGEQKIRQRVALANWGKNYQRGIVMDQQDEWDHKQLSFAGLAEAQAGIREQVAADMRIPITKLFGTSASKGIGQTDQNDMENYNSMVQSDVRDKTEYDLLRVAEIRCQQRYGFIPDDLEIEWPSLRELTETDAQTVKTGVFTCALQASEANKINDKEFRDILNKANVFPIHLDSNNASGTDEDQAELTADDEDESPAEKEEQDTKAGMVGQPDRKGN